jgi:thiamine biosynthesis lipoprotein
MLQRELQISRRGELWCGRFEAMASPCEVLVDSTDRQLADELTRLGAREAWRIESAFSRYRDDNIVHRINNAAGTSIEVDEETARLLDFADQCYALSEGLFDITSGVLRRAWRFDGGRAVPDADVIERLLPKVGWRKVIWEKPRLTLPKGMEIDFGGIGKEYAVDSAQQLLAAHTDVPALINLGGDLAVTRNRCSAAAWRAGVEDPAGGGARGAIQIQQGALATSGDTYRYVLKDGVRYGHILDPRSGWPVAGAPRSVTVAAPNCTQAGMLATFSMLQGSAAEDFLQAQEVPHWCQR